MDTFDMSSNGNGNNNDSHMKEEEISNKRAALAGQWRTPPLPVFPNNTAGTNPAAGLPHDSALPEVATSSTETAQVPAALPPVDKLPASTEDYVKALQEAYLRGAEAAAAMAATPNMSSAASCPDFQGSIVLPQPVVTTTGDTQVASAAAVASTSTAAAPILPPPAAPVSLPTTTSTSPSSTTMPPPPPVPTAEPGQLMAQQQQQQQQQQLPQRSLSLPDMSSYAAQQEDEKRQKRLARNRASARLRRLRKKNLVDAYETEVGILESTLAKLRAHEWGQHQDGSALVEALGMDRGQQELGPTERQQAAADILQQQLSFVQQLEELMQEQYVLYQIAADSGEFQELKEALQLTPEQIQHLQETASGWHDEWAALQTVKESLLVMKENDWLWNQGVNSIADQFMNIMHKNQISKFLLWADHNVEAIDELDIVNAPLGGVPNGPVFQFGADSNPAESITMDEDVARAAMGNVALS